MESRFNRRVEWVGDMIDRGSKYLFELEDFECFRKFIKNWEMVELCVYEENEEGSSDNWDLVEFVEYV
tara:strand:- start:7282 stop:7485 length:204 start_codon:yes stop_codon:yes gene_type:complete